MDVYLERRFPIKHRDGLRNLPTCHYRWPNGQGDVAKFLEGIENSTAWERKNGAVYRIWSGMNSEVVLTQPHHLQAVFKDSDKHTKAVANNSGYYMKQLLGKCVGLISGREWRTVRSVMEVPFGHQVVSTIVADVERQVNEHFQQLHTHGSLEQNLIHPAEDMKMLPFWVVCEIFYGRLPLRLTQQLKDLAPLREHVFKYVIQGGLPRFTFSQYLPTSANADLREFKQRWKAFNTAAHAHALAHDPSAPIVKMYAATASGEMTEDQLLQTLDESLYANLDVTTGGLSWNLVFLAAHPDVQSRLRCEVAAAETEDRLQSYVLSGSTYLASCVLESSRLKPLAAFSVPQAAPTAREVDGYVIPAGTNFVVDAYALNVRNEAWGPENTTYRPERFLKRRDTELRYLFWRFGFGPRQCMGKYAADLVIRLALVHLVRGYEMSLLGGEEWTRNTQSWITHPDFQLRCVRRA